MAQKVEFIKGKSFSCLDEWIKEHPAIHIDSVAGCSTGWVVVYTENLIHLTENDRWLDQLTNEDLQKGTEDVEHT